MIVGILCGDDELGYNFWDNESGQARTRKFTYPNPGRFPIFLFGNANYAGRSLITGIEAHATSPKPVVNPERRDRRQLAAQIYPKRPLQEMPVQFTG